MDAIIGKKRYNVQIFQNFLKEMMHYFYIWFVDKRDNSKKLIENRCGSCGHLLFKARNLQGEIEQKCARCGSVQTIKIQPEGRSYQERLTMTHK